MLTRTLHPNGVVTYHSPLLQQIAIPHAFSTRLGGISTGPYASLNLGNPADAPTPDSPENIRQNYTLLRSALGIPSYLRAWVKQIHSNQVALLSPEPENEYAENLAAEIEDRWHGQIEADALLTSLPKVLLTIRIADCVPILLASDDGRTVAAVHAGWRGVVKGVLPRTLRAFAEEGIPTKNIRAAIGPHISADHFEIGEEVVKEFHRAGLSHALRPVPNAKPHADLQSALLHQLHTAGVLHIDTNTLCTFRDSAHFFSHRRDHGITGRLAAVIAVAQPHPPSDSKTPQV